MEKKNVHTRYSSEENVSGYPFFVSGKQIMRV